MSIDNQKKRKGIPLKKLSNNQESASSANFIVDFKQKWGTETEEKGRKFPFLDRHASKTLDHKHNPIKAHKRNQIKPRSSKPGKISNFSKQHKKDNRSYIPSKKPTIPRDNDTHKTIAKPIDPNTPKKDIKLRHKIQKRQRVFSMRTRTKPVKRSKANTLKNPKNIENKQNRSSNENVTNNSSQNDLQPGYPLHDDQITQKEKLPRLLSKFKLLK